MLVFILFSPSFAMKGLAVFEFVTHYCRMVFLSLKSTCNLPLVAKEGYLVAGRRRRTKNYGYPKRTREDGASKAIWIFYNFTPMIHELKT